MATEYVDAGQAVPSVRKPLADWHQARIAAMLEQSQALKVIYEKTGSLIATSGRFGAMFSGANGSNCSGLCSCAR